MDLIELERELASRFIRDFALLTSSGSFAIVTALNASNVAKGSSVIMPASCCPIVLFAIQMAGFNVVLADVSMNSLSMELSDIVAVFDSSVSVIVAVHGYGHYCKIDDIVAFAKRRHLVVIEDACLAYGGTYKNKPLGSYGDFSILSFGYDKPINNQYGGAVLTNNSDYYQRAKEFIFNNKMIQYAEFEQLGTLKAQVSKLQEYGQSRKSNVEYLQNNIKNPLFTKVHFDQEVSFWRYPLLLENRDPFLVKAKQENIVFTKHYQSLGDLQTHGYFPNSKRISNQIINLFVRPETPEQQLTDMVTFINAYRYE